MARRPAVIPLCAAVLAGSAFPRSGSGQELKRVNARVATGWQHAMLFARPADGNVRDSELGQFAFELGLGIEFTADFGLDLSARLGSGTGLETHLGSIGMVVRPLSPGEELYVRAGLAYMSAQVSVDCVIAEGRHQASAISTSAGPETLSTYLSCAGPYRASNLGFELSAGAVVSLSPHLAAGPVLWFAHSVGGTTGSRTVGGGIRIVFQ